MSSLLQTLDSASIFGREGNAACLEQGEQRGGSASTIMGFTPFRFLLCVVEVFQ